MGPEAAQVSWEGQVGSPWAGAHLVLWQGGERLEVVEVQVLAVLLVEARGGGVHGLHPARSAGACAAAWDSGHGPRPRHGSPPCPSPPWRIPNPAGHRLCALPGRTGHHWLRAPGRHGNAPAACRSVAERRRGGRLGRGQGWRPESRGHWRAGGTPGGSAGVLGNVGLRGAPGGRPALPATVRGGATLVCAHLGARRGEGPSPPRQHR